MNQLVLDTNQASVDGLARPRTVALETLVEHADSIPKTDHTHPSTFSPHRIKIGKLLRLLTDGTSMVQIPGLDSCPVAARALVACNELHPGQDVALMFEDGEGSRPVILGPIDAPHEHLSQQLPIAGTESPVIDLDQLIIDARHEIVLRCGKASISLTKSGKIVIRGTYLLSRSSGVNSVKGGIVKLN